MAYFGYSRIGIIRPRAELECEAHQPFETSTPKQVVDKITPRWKEATKRKRLQQGGTTWD